MKTKIGMTILIFIISLSLTGCNNIDAKSSSNFNVANIKLGDSYDSVVEKLGEPTESKNATLTYRNDEGLFMVLHIQDNKVQSLDAYPIYEKEMLVSDQTEVIEKFGEPQLKGKVQCYQTAECQQFSYKDNNQRLEILFNFEGENVDRIKLYNE